MDEKQAQEIKENPEYRIIKNTDGRRNSAYEEMERSGEDWLHYMNSRGK